MQEVRAVKDDDINFVTFLDDTKTVIAAATDVLILWSETKDAGSLANRYEAFRQALAQKWGQDVNSGTAYIVLEKATEMVSLLKKTHLPLPSLKS